MEEKVCEDEGIWDDVVALAIVIEELEVVEEVQKVGRIVGRS